MLVTAYKTVDIETEVNVTAADFLQEIENRLRDADPGHWRRMTEGIAGLIQVLLELDPKVIDSVLPSPRKIIAEKLHEAAKLWEVKQ